MKKLFVLLLFIPIFSFGQIILDKKLGEIDIRDIDDKYISVECYADLNSNHYLTSSKYRELRISADTRKRKWNVYDDGQLTTLSATIDLLNFFDKYGWKLVKSDTTTGGAVTNYYSNINLSVTSQSSSTTIIFTRK
tara:strand:+ start:386 stop:793 length:408 start_codon:yes stop_codon:yes gene_type:complete